MSEDYLALERAVREELPDYPLTVIALSVAESMGLPTERVAERVRVYVRGKPGSGSFLYRVDDNNAS